MRKGFRVFVVGRFVLFLLMGMVLWEVPSSAVGASCVTVVGVFCLLARRYTGVWNVVVFKPMLVARGVWHFLVSRDKSWDAYDAAVRVGGPRKIETVSFGLTKENGESVPASMPVEVKRVLFLRHGESEWNEVFNRGYGLGFLVRLMRALLREFLLIPSRDSVFFDSGLNGDGASQARAVADFLEESPGHDEDVDAIVRPSVGTSVAVCSNLRRSIATALIVARNRIRKHGLKVLLLSDLQEITVNVDGMALAKPFETPEMGRFLSYFPADMSVSEVLDATHNRGTKTLESNGLKRMLGFLHWAFSREERTIIILGGHSLWLRSFLRTFLPSDYEFQGKQSKLVNCGLVAFDVTRSHVDGKDMYSVEPKTIRMISGGFR